MVKGRQPFVLIAILVLGLFLWFVDSAFTSHI